MSGNSLGIILLAMAVGLVVGFEVGQHLMRKQFSAMIHQALEAAKKQAEEQKAERDKRLEEIQESAKKLKEEWIKIQEGVWEKVLRPSDAEPVSDTETVSVKEYNEQVKKEQMKNGIQH